MTTKATVYCLFDPNNGELRYIGKTISELSVRLQHHIYRATKAPTNYNYNWIRSLLEKDLKPEIKTLQEFDSEVDALAAEIYWINYFKQQGCRLTNTHSGGNGCRSRTSETKAKIATFMIGNTLRQGKHHSVETKAKIGASGKGRRHSKETRVKMSMSHMGKKRGPMSFEVKAKIAISLRLRKIREQEFNKQEVL